MASCWCGESFDGEGSINGYPMDVWRVLEHHYLTHEKVVLDNTYALPLQSKT